MHTTNLRKVGGSVMLAVPPAILDLLHLQAGATVGVAVADGRLAVDPKPRQRYPGRIVGRSRSLWHVPAVSART